ncbi:MAG: hypothetical protein NVS3B3_18570 [Aquirhabdus sp.]
MKNPAILSEGQLAETAEAMRLISSAGRHIDRTLGALQHCRVSVDADSFRNIQFHLDEAHRKLAVIPLAHINALDAQRAGR